MGNLLPSTYFVVGIIFWIFPFIPPTNVMSEILTSLICFPAGILFFYEGYDIFVNE